MPSFAEIARVNVNEPRVADDDQRDAWLLWRSVFEEARRRDACVTNDGFYIYRGSLRQHVRRLWPTLSKDERVSLEKRIYAYLHVNDIARCVQRKDPTVWHIAMTWHDSPQKIAVMRYVPTRSEKKVTADEAGENLPAGEVTVRMKPTKGLEDVSGNSKRGDSLTPFHQKMTDERVARRLLVAEFLGTVTEPIVADEVAHVFDVDISTARHDLAALAEDGVIATREETVEERRMRFDGTAFARRSQLFWPSAPVPPRKSRQVVDGYVAELKERKPSTSTHEINRKLWARFEKMGPRSRFTSSDIAEKTGLGFEAVRKRVAALVEAGAIKRCGSRQSSRLYRIVHKDKIRVVLEQPAAKDMLPLVEETPFSEETNDVTTSEKAQPWNAPTAADESLQDFLVEVLDDNESLRKRVKELEAELAALKKPKIDPDLARRIKEWKPSA